MFSRKRVRLFFVNCWVGHPENKGGMMERQGVIPNECIACYLLLRYRG